jgi:hypothetical protein
MSFYTPFSFVKQAAAPAGPSGPVVPQTDLFMWFDPGNTACWSGTGDDFYNLVTGNGYDLTGATNLTLGTNVMTANATDRTWRFQKNNANARMSLDMSSVGSIPLSSAGWTLFQFYKRASTLSGHQMISLNNYSTNRLINTLSYTPYTQGARFEINGGGANVDIWPTTISAPQNTWFYIAISYDAVNDVAVTYSEDGTVTNTSTNNGGDSSYTPSTEAAFGVVQGTGDVFDFYYGAWGLYTTYKNATAIAAIKTTYTNLGYYV